MSAPNDGGPAFPAISTKAKAGISSTYGDVTSAGGMSLRDWFAARRTGKNIRTSEAFIAIAKTTVKRVATKVVICLPS